MLTLAMVSFPWYSEAISSSAGAMALHGPHHSAQKSTSTGPLAFNTSVAKDWSVTALVFSLIGRLSMGLQGRRWGQSGVRSTRQIGHGDRGVGVEQRVRQHRHARRAGPYQGAAHR